MRSAVMRWCSQAMRRAWGATRVLLGQGDPLCAQQQGTVQRASVLQANARPVARLVLKVSLALWSLRCHRSQAPPSTSERWACKGRQVRSAAEGPGAGGAVMAQRSTFPIIDRFAGEARQRAVGGSDQEDDGAVGVELMSILPTYEANHHYSYWHIGIRADRMAQR